MNTPNLNTLLCNFLSQLGQTINKGSIWVQGQLPDLIKELLEWHLAIDISWMAFSMFAIIGALFVHKNLRKTNYTWNDGPLLLVMWFIYIFSLGLFLSRMFDMLEILIAPKLYIIEYAASLVHH